MIVECPHCSKRYETDPQNVGRNMKCPNCEKDFEIQNPNLMPCPDCFSMISKRATGCPRCGAPISTSLTTQASQPQQAAQDDISKEEDIMVCQPSAMNYLWTIIFGIITIPAFIGLVILIYVLIEINFTRYRITTMRVLVKRGWISKYQNEIWIKDMRAVNLNQGTWQRIIGVGNIAIGTAATSGTEINMIGIADPQSVVDKINALRR
jgi:membrane protein YdbS with pleckstrin-like domain